ncbi:oxygenase MpaB family protein [Haloferula sp. A504]|uniref:oxygenase MpaB family protein n=1 Tax=Haloferula sp. A504 TaxID=3373601 RepID=UPI0031BDD187|nr:oxygenase MpaB family protein [Verrucomicrobiaceae bacterium E54]
MNPLAPFARWIDAALREQLLEGDDVPTADFLNPAGEAALAGPDSVSWRIFRNPLALYIGGITAVLLELAEPRVRTGVWEHTSFRTNPLRRMRRTGLAAMVTVYAARSVAEEMIAGVGRMHARIAGTTPDGRAYRADDPELLRWVHATALFGFMEACHHYVTPLSQDERDAFIAEGVPAAKLYGAVGAPASEAGMHELFAQMEPHLESSEIIAEFLEIMERLSLFPRPLRAVNRWLIAAAIDLLPGTIRGRLELEARKSPPKPVARMLRWSGAAIDRLHLESAPATQACRRLGLPADHLRRTR